MNGLHMILLGRKYYVERVGSEFTAWMWIGNNIICQCEYASVKNSTTVMLCTCLHLFVFYGLIFYRGLDLVVLRAGLYIAVYTCTLHVICTLYIVRVLRVYFRLAKSINDNECGTRKMMCSISSRVDKK